MQRALLILIFFISYAHSLIAQNLSDSSYEIGNPSMTDIYVDPTHGSDSNTGESSSRAFKTLTQAWNSISQGQTLTTGVRVNILPGTIPESGIPNYMESRYGTYNAPIIIRASQGAGTVTLGGDLNVYDTRYLYLLDLTISPQGDTFHCEKCDHILIRGGEYDGGNKSAHETIKINQSQYIYIENTSIHGADDNAIDFVSVQFGHIINSKIYNAQDWCAYAKGGSAYIRVEGNEIYNCGTGGFTAGQGSGFEFMTSPWIHYEAYDIKIVNNIIHDTEGAGIGINGGYNILAAHNTLYRVGSRSHTLEVVYGFRSCDGNTTDCQTRLSAGGWGTTTTGTEGEPIGDRNVFIYNNIIYNPSGFQAPGQIFAVYGPRTPNAGTNLSSPQRTDFNLVIKGNLIYSNPGTSALGIEESDQGCQSSNTTCNETQLRADNQFNVAEPQLKNPASNDFRPLSGGNVFSYPGVSIPSFNGGDRESTPEAPEGVLSNSVLRDRGNTTRESSFITGAYQSADSEIAPPGAGGSDGGDSSDSAPKISKASCSPKKGSKGSTVTCSVTASDDKKISSVNIFFGTKVMKKLSKSKNVYKGSFKSKKGKFKGKVVVTDSASQKTEKNLGTFNFK